MLYLTKNKNFFDQFCKDVYTIEYQKRGLPHIYLFIFFYSVDSFLETSQIDEIIYTKLLTLDTNPIGELIRILTSVMLYGLYKDINLHSTYMSNIQDSLSKYTKHYLCNFFEETFIQENGYPIYR